MLTEDIKQLTIKVKAQQAQEDLLKLSEQSDKMKQSWLDQGKALEDLKKTDAFKEIVAKMKAANADIQAARKTDAAQKAQIEEASQAKMWANFQKESNSLRELEKLRRSLRAKQTGANADDPMFAETTKNLALVENRIEKMRDQIKQVKAEMKLDGSIFQDAKIIGSANLNQLTNAAEALRAKLNTLAPETAEFIETSKRLQMVKSRLDQINGVAPKEGSNGLFGQIFGGVTAGNLAAAGIQKVLEFTVNTMKEGYQATKEYQSALSELTAITGASGFELEGLQQKAEELTTIMLNGGVKITNSSSDILTAFKLVGSAKPELLKDSEALQEVTKQTILLSKATGMSLPDAVGYATTILNQFEAPAKDTARYINAIAAGSKEGAAEIPDVAAAIKEFGAGAKSANVSIEESVALVETLGDKMIKGSEAGTSLRNVLLIMKAPDALGKDAQEALKANNVSTKVLSDNSLTLGERLKELSKIKGDATAMTKVFGKENVTAGEIILTNVDRFNQLNTAIQGSNEAYRQAGAMADNLGNLTDNLTDNWARLIKTIGTDVDGAFKIIIKDINEVIDDMVRSIDPVQQATQEHKNLADATEGLTKNIQPMLTEYDNLIKKGNLTTAEQARLESIVKDVTAAVPGVITQFNEYGEAMRINTERARGFITSQIEMTASAKSHRIEILSQEIVKLEERNKVIQEYQNKGTAERKWFQLVRKADAAALFEQEHELSKNIASTAAYKEQLKQLQGVGGVDDRTAAMKREEAALEALDKKSVTHTETTKKATEEKKKQKKEVQLLANTVAFLKDELGKLNTQFDNAPSTKTPEIAAKIATATIALAKAEDALEKIRDAAFKKALGRKDNGDLTALGPVKAQNIGDIKTNLDVQLAQAIADNKVMINRERLEKEAADEQKHRDFQKQLFDAGIEAAQTAANAIFQITAQNSQQRKSTELKEVDDSYKQKLDKAKNNKKLTEKLESEIAAKKLEIEKAAFERDKKRSIIQALINGALGITKTFAAYGFTPAGWIAAGLQAISTAANIAVISNQKFAKGGILQGASHSAGGIAAIDSRTGRKVAEFEGGEPIMVLSQKTYANNRDVIDALLNSSMENGGKRIFEDGGIFAGSNTNPAFSRDILRGSQSGTSIVNIDLAVLVAEIRDLKRIVNEEKVRPAMISFQELETKQDLVTDIRNYAKNVA